MAHLRLPREQAPTWLFVSVARPCPVCGMTDGCRVCEVGDYVCCFNEPSDRPMLGGGWFHELHTRTRTIVAIHV